jgi:hypothetical protein
MRPPVDRIAPITALDEAVLMNSLLDIGGILASSRNLGFNLRQPEGKKPQGNQMVAEELTVSLAKL